MAADKKTLLREALKQVQAGKIDKAIDTYRAIIKLDPRDAAVRNSLADLLGRQGKKKDAVAEYLEAAALYEKDGFGPRAIAICQKIVKLDGEQWGVRLKLGDLYAAQKLPAEARAIYLQLADRHDRRGEVAAALEVFRRLADLDPANLSMRVKLGEMFEKQSQPEQAAAEYVRAAKGHEARKEKDAAVDLLVRAFKLSPANLEARRFLADHHAQRQEWQVVVGLLETPVAGGTADIDLAVLYADALTRVKHAPEAIAILEKLQANEPNAVPVNLVLGRAYLASGEIEKGAVALNRCVGAHLAENRLELAESVLQEMAAAAPGDDRILQRIIEVALKRGDTAGAAEAYLKLAAVFEKKGLVRNAVGALERYLESRPGDASAKERLERLKASVPAPTPASAPVVAPAVAAAPQEAAPKPAAIVPAPAPVVPVAGAPEAEEEIEIEIEGIDDLSGLDLEGEEEELVVADAGEGVAVEEPEAPVQAYGEISLEEAAPAPESPAPSVAVYGEIPMEETPAVEAEGASAEDYAEVSLEEMAVESEEPGEASLAEMPIEPLIEALPESIGEPAAVEEPTASEEPVSIEEPMPAEVQAVIEEPAAPPVQPPEPAAPDGGATPAVEFEDLLGDLRQEIEAEGDLVPPPLEDAGVHEIFQEFQRSVKAQLGDEDFETHYNLGIAYKEMGLVEEAIGEFSLAERSPTRRIDAVSMATLCLREQGRFDEAAQKLRTAVALTPEGSEQQKGMLYDLAAVHEQAGRADLAAEALQRLHAMDPAYRDVAARIGPPPPPADSPRRKPKVSYL